MVVLNIKRAEKFLFLYETTLSASVDEVLQDICLLINGRLKVLRLADAIGDLANHGIAKAPKVRGLLENQVRKLLIAKVSKYFMPMMQIFVSRFKN